MKLRIEVYIGMALLACAAVAALLTCSGCTTPPADPSPVYPWQP